MYIEFGTYYKNGNDLVELVHYAACYKAPAGDVEGNIKDKMPQGRFELLYTF